jgi:hypothetical protein
MASSNYGWAFSDPDRFFLPQWQINAREAQTTLSVLPSRRGAASISEITQVQCARRDDAQAVVFAQLSPRTSRERWMSQSWMSALWCNVVARPLVGALHSTWSRPVPASPKRVSASKHRLNRRRYITVLAFLADRPPPTSYLRCAGGTPVESPYCFDVRRCAWISQCRSRVPRGELTGDEARGRSLDLDLDTEPDSPVSSVIGKAAAGLSTRRSCPRGRRRPSLLPLALPA